MAARVSEEAQKWSDEKYSLFFYGTLLHPAVLKRVLGHEGSGLSHQPAALYNYERHRVKDQDYPAILSSTQSEALLAHSKMPDIQKSENLADKYVRGSLVAGFSKLDVELLDVFEGDEYQRQVVKVVPLAPPQSLNIAAADDGIVFDPVNIPPTQDGSKSEVTVLTYVWVKDPLNTLEPELWSYETFVKDNLHKWVGSEVDRASYLEVDKRIERNTPTIQDDVDQTALEDPSARIQQLVDSPSQQHGHQQIENGALQDQQKDEKGSEYVFGHAMLKYFCFEDGYINMNNGSYGVSPRPVYEAAQRILDRIEVNPDRFIRITLAPMLVDVRTRLAKFINAPDVDDVVLVPNTSHGINVVFHNIDWQPDDILIGFTTTYESVFTAIHRYADVYPGIDLQIIPLQFPTTPDAIISRFSEHVKNLQRKPGAKVVAIIDGIMSKPSAWLPWEDLVKICRENDVLSIVDGAHVVGQIPLDLKRADPDFFVTSCHKWLFSRRSCAILYVHKRNQQMMRSTFPISTAYISPPAPVDFIGSYTCRWIGTVDYSPFLVVNAALDFRETIGGEAKIQEYSHRLAREGGKKVAEILGTEMLDKDDQFTASMVDVELPIPESIIQTAQSSISTLVFEMQLRMIEEWHAAVAIYLHRGRMYVRCCAHIWLEVSDFEYVARALQSLCSEFCEKLSQPQVSETSQAATDFESKANETITTTTN